MEILKKLKFCFCLLVFYSLLTAPDIRYALKRKIKDVIGVCETKCLNGFKHTIRYIYIKCKVNINGAFFAALGPLRPVCTCEALLKVKKNKDESTQRRLTAPHLPLTRAHLDPEDGP